MGRRHNQEIAHSRGGQPRMHICRHLVRKVVSDPRIKGEPAFVDHESNRQRNEAFADRIHPVFAIRRPRGPVALRRDTVAAHQQEAVHVDPFSVDPLEEIQDRRRRDTQAFRGGCWGKEIFRIVCPGCVHWVLCFG